MRNCSGQRRASFLLTRRGESWKASSAPARSGIASWIQLFHGQYANAAEEMERQPTVAECWLSCWRPVENSCTSVLLPFLKELPGSSLRKQGLTHCAMDFQL